MKPMRSPSLQLSGFIGTLSATVTLPLCEVRRTPALKWAT